MLGRRPFPRNHPQPHISCLHFCPHLQSCQHTGHKHPVQQFVLMLARRPFPRIHPQPTHKCASVNKIWSNTKQCRSLCRLRTFPLFRGPYVLTVPFQPTYVWQSLPRMHSMRLLYHMQGSVLPQRVVEYIRSHVAKPASKGTMHCHMLTYGETAMQHAAAG